MSEQIIEQLINQFIEFSLEKREVLPKILLILIFLLFLVRKNRKEGISLNVRKAKIDKALDYLSDKVSYRGEYTIPKEVEKKLYQNNFNRASILMLVASIMKHMGLPNTIPGINVYNVSNCGDVEPGRCYMYGDGQSTITINLLPEYDVNTVAAIVIHECMHHYLNVRRMKFKDKLENEILTDTCAIYSGFGEIIYEGYKTRAIYYKGENKLRSMGYLTQSEIRYIMRKL